MTGPTEPCEARANPVADSLLSGDRLGRAIVTGPPAFIRRAKAMEDALAALRSRIAAELERRRRALGGAAAPRAVRDFNRRWASFLASVPIGDVQRAQAAYNAFYAIEREVALPGAPVARFTPVPVLTRADLQREWPGLSSPA